MNWLNNLRCLLTISWIQQKQIGHILFSAFREKTFSNNSAEYMRATYNLSEILLTTQWPFDNATGCDITELKSFILGRCYMICFKKAHLVTTPTYLWVKRSSDLTGIRCQFFSFHILFTFYQSCVQMPNNSFLSLLKPVFPEDQVLLTFAVFKSLKYFT